MLAIKYVRLPDAILWDRNPKRHDTEALKSSIRRYGFRDAPIFDETLGAIVAGNGRLGALVGMRTNGEAPPEGVRVDEDGEWLAPIQVGISASSAAEAEAFGIDHNNLTLIPSEASPESILAIWDRTELGEVLSSLSESGVEPLTASASLTEALEGLAQPEITPATAATPAVLRTVILVSDVSVVEAALSKTSLKKRSDALMEICRAYLRDSD